MTQRSTTLGTRAFILVSFAVVSLFGIGCGSNSSTGSLGAQMVPSTTPPAVHLIKLVPKAASGAEFVVDVVIYGPDVTLDMYTFAFDVKIGDPTIVQFVSGSAVAGDALQAFALQSISAQAAPSGGDPSDIVVGVGKLGGGVGNGVAGASAVVVEMTFQVLKAGATTMMLTGTPPFPEVLDSNGAPIASLTYDSGSATVTGVASSGGGY
jgi:hypothetical protein